MSSDGSRGVVESNIANQTSSVPRAADQIVARLDAANTGLWCGVPGGAISPLYDAAALVGSRPIVNVHHETMGVFAAMAHARLTGKVPVVLVTSGPGITNALTGVASAYVSRTPCLIIAGDVATANAGRGALQDSGPAGIDALTMVAPITRYAARLDDSSTLQDHLDRALAAAAEGGPAFLLLPIDVALRPLFASTSPCVSTGSRVETVDFGVDLDRVAAEMLGVERGLLLLGSGASSKNARRAALSLANALQWPVATSPRGKGVFPEDHPLAVGVLGYGGHPSAEACLAQGVDMLLAVGCGLREASTNSWSLPLRSARSLVQVDSDPHALGRNYPVDVPICSRAETILPALLRRVRARTEPAPVAPRRYGVTRRPAENPRQGPRVVVGPQLRLPWVMQQVSARCPNDAVITADIGEHLLFALHFLTITEHQDFFGDTVFGSMGSGIGMAVGAAMSHPRRPVLALCGDYGFQMFGMELATCVEQRLDIVVVVLNDGRMGMVENGFSRVYGRELGWSHRRVDFAGLAAALGARAHVIRSIDDFEAVAPRLWAKGGPMLLDVHIDAGEQYPASARDATLSASTTSSANRCRPGFELD